jgi:hypothetical protein
MENLHHGQLWLLLVRKFAYPVDCINLEFLFVSF